MKGVKNKHLKLWVPTTPDQKNYNLVLVKRFGSFSARCGGTHLQSSTWEVKAERFQV
jgi:hypothetical protein